MASTDGVTPLYNNVVISVYGGPGSKGFGIRSVGGTPSNNVQWAVGTVYKIGENVYRITVGEKVGFRTECFFATDISDDTFAVVPQDNIVIKFTALP